MIPLLARVALGARRGIGSASTALTKGIRSGLGQIGRGVNLSTSLTVNSARLSKKLKRASDKKVESAMNLALAEVRPLTPKRTGRARSGWKLKGKGVNMTLSNTVPYIKQLDRGWSKQAPNGIIVPLTRKLKGRI